jgi:hypothetical protein
MSMKRSSAKAKGRKLQDWVRNKLIYYLTLSPKVIDIEGHIKCAIMGESGADVQLTPSIIHLFPFSIECKNQEKFSGIYNIIDQATNHSRHPPIAFIKMNRRKPLVILEADVFLDSWFKDERENN